MCALGRGDAGDALQLRQAVGADGADGAEELGGHGQELASFTRLDGNGPTGACNHGQRGWAYSISIIIPQLVITGTLRKWLWNTFHDIYFVLCYYNTVC